MVTASHTLYQFPRQSANCHIGKADPVFISAAAVHLSEGSAAVYWEHLSTL